MKKSSIFPLLFIVIILFLPLTFAAISEDQQSKAQEWWNIIKQQASEAFSNPINFTDYKMEWIVGMRDWQGKGSSFIAPYDWSSNFIKKENGSLFFSAIIMTAIFLGISFLFYSKKIFTKSTPIRWLYWILVLGIYAIIVFNLQESSAIVLGTFLNLFTPIFDLSTPAYLLWLNKYFISGLLTIFLIFILQLFFMKIEDNTTRAKIQNWMFSNTFLSFFLFAFSYSFLMGIPLINRFLQIITFELLLPIDLSLNHIMNFIIHTLIMTFYLGIVPASFSLIKKKYYETKQYKQDLEEATGKEISKTMARA